MIGSVQANELCSFAKQIETRNGDKTWNKDDIAEYNRIRSHAQRIVDILTHED